MEGYVSSDRLEPRLTVNILDYRGTVVPVEAVIDTGFTGFMTLPDADINTLQLEQNRNRRIRLADGRIRQFQTYFATVIWHGNPITVSALVMPGRPLIGMSLLWNSDVAIAARENGLVTITEAAET
ncbi:MAG: clan AA aspartic protease [Chloroflexi bacterium]|nr:clan AA aspartic protease [Chloroflexota bacterium]